MSKGIISVIVPIYNTKDYLRRCIDSIRNQTYSKLEIILVDDGSTDGSSEICDQYAKIDERIRVIHKKNGGQGSARNLALNKAKGEYIAFVDSDDWIAENMYSVLLENLNNFEADIACCRNGMIGDIDSRKQKVFTQPELMLEHLYDHAGTGQSPCDKLYKKSVFDDVRFLEMRAYEDCATIFKVLAKTNKLIYEDITLYYYERRNNSTMTQAFSEIKYQAIYAYLEMYRFYEANYTNYAAQAKKRLIGSIQYCIGETLILKKRKELGDSYDWAIQIVKELSKSDISIKHKMSLFLIQYLPAVYKAVYKIRTM